MIIAIASGKGGTGKTTVATNLALFLSGEKSRQIQFLDCDVEEPNAHIFLKPEIEKSKPVSLLIPDVDQKKCTFCGKCAEVCAYNAIVALEKEVLIFPELCHGCGGCSLLCQENAISEKKREIGVLEEGRAGSVKFAQGRLNIGEPMAPPVIRAVKRTINTDGITIIDVPPGTSCPVIESINGSDFCLLVTEPTPFGLHDLKLAVELLKKLKIKHGVLINRAGIGDDRVKDYCDKEGVPVLAQIPFDRKVAVLYSRGIPLWASGERFREIFRKLWESIESQISVDR
ncbi:MAG: ATP-binding protein [Candidatus Zixiibacteriota bacterium]